MVRAAAAWEAPLLRFAAGGGEGMAYCEWDRYTLVVKDMALYGLDVPAACAICIGNSVCGPMPCGFPGRNARRRNGALRHDQMAASL